MTFKELTNDLMDKGWRVYHIDDLQSVSKGDDLQRWAVRNIKEIQIYEGHSLVFVKNGKPLEDK